MAISAETRAFICARHTAGLSSLQISQETAVNERTVRRILERYRTTGQWGKNTGGGRPRATTPAQDQTIIAKIEEQPQLTARALRNVSNLPVSTRTVIRRLHEGGKTPRVGRLKEAALLNPAVRAKRLQWAEEQGREWAWWSDRTVFVDECIFESSPCHRTKTWRSSDENGPFFNYVRRSGRVSLAVFGGICGNEVLPLFISLSERSERRLMVSARGRHTFFWNDNSRYLFQIFMKFCTLIPRHGKMCCIVFQLSQPRGKYNFFPFLCTCNIDLLQMFRATYLILRSEIKVFAGEKNRVTTFHLYLSLIRRL